MDFLNTEHAEKVIRAINNLAPEKRIYLKIKDCAYRAEKIPEDLIIFSVSV